MKLQSVVDCMRLDIVTFSVLLLGTVLFDTIYEVLISFSHTALLTCYLHVAMHFPVFNASIITLAFLLNRLG
jgi:hypothetical protein